MGRAQLAAAAKDRSPRWPPDRERPEGSKDAQRPALGSSSPMVAVGRPGRGGGCFQREEVTVVWLRLGCNCSKSRTGTVNCARRQKMGRRLSVGFIIFSQKCLRFQSASALPVLCLNQGRRSPRRSLWPPRISMSTKDSPLADGFATSGFGNYCFGGSLLRGLIYVSPRFPLSVSLSLFAPLGSSRCAF